MRSCLWSLNLFQSDLDKSWICVRILVARSRGETPGAHVADAVTLVVEGGERQPGIFKAVTQKLYWGRNDTDLLNLLLKQLSGIPRRETVVNGTKQSSASVEELSL